MCVCVSLMVFVLGTCCQKEKFIVKDGFMFSWYHINHLIKLLSKAEKLLSIVVLITFKLISWLLLLQLISCLHFL